jgi:hypothetical protein
MTSLIDKLKGKSLDSILNAILNSKQKIHKREFQATIVWVYEQWENAENSHAKKVLRGAYKKFVDSYFYTFGEDYHNSLHNNIVQAIRETEALRHDR